jgi:hypothetical protein
MIRYPAHVGLRAGFQIDAAWAENLDLEITTMLSRLASQVDEFVSETEYIRTPSGSPFCGCEVCEIREILVMTIAATLAAQRDGLVELL